ncbi:hypothetical protein GCM10027422_43320 [Hymenobacter arcticus]
MSYAHRPQPTAPQPAAPEGSPCGGGRYLTAARRQALYAAAPPTEPLPRCPPSASLAGQLRVLELQRDNLNRAIARLRAQPPLTSF